MRKTEGDHTCGGGCGGCIHDRRRIIDGHTGGTAGGFGGRDRMFIRGGTVTSFLLLFLTVTITGECHRKGHTVGVDGRNILRAILGTHPVATTRRCGTHLTWWREVRIGIKQLFRGVTFTSTPLTLVPVPASTPISIPTPISAPITVPVLVPSIAAARGSVPLVPFPRRSHNDSSAH